MSRVIDCRNSVLVHEDVVRSMTAEWRLLLALFGKRAHGPYLSIGTHHPGVTADAARAAIRGGAK